MPTTNRSFVRVDGKVPLHAKLNPQPRDDRAAVRQRLDSELLKITAANWAEPVARECYRKLAMITARALGACHLIKSDQAWRLANVGVTGRVPTALDVEETLASKCEQIYASGKPKLITLECLDDLTAVVAPIPVQGQSPELFLLVSKPDRDSQATIEIMQHVVAAMRLWLARKSAAEASWQVGSLASIIELVGRIETSDSLKSAAEEIVNATLRPTGASAAAIAFTKKGHQRLAAVSGVQKLDTSSQTCRDYQQALSEASIRQQQAIFPATDADNNHLLCAHQQLAATVQEQAVISQPLLTSDGNDVGAWCFTGNQNLIHSDQISRFVTAASPHVADAIQILRRAEKSRWSRLMTAIVNKTSVSTRVMIPLAIAAFLLAMWLPVTYRVRCNGTVEPASRRFAVAPFNGLVVAGFAEPGDVVAVGQVLAEIDGRSIRWELSGVTAERLQSLRQREMELSERNIPKAFLAELENERLTAEEKILNFKRENLQIKSPVAGVVLSGSLERAEAASVTTGQVLFEIGTTDRIKIQLAIPAEEIAQAAVGQPVTIWIEGQEDRPLKSTIARIQPRSEIRDARNVFVAEIEFANPEERFRPGMQGSVRIDGEQRSLGWTLFHKPINYMRSRCAWW